MKRGLVLLWTERVLLTAGVVLGVYVAAQMIEARFVRSLPIPHQYVDVSKALPGDAGSPSRASASPAPAAGTWLARLEMPTIGLTATVLEGSDDDTLRRGAGHIEDTSFPDDTGAHSNIGIAGHRDTIFRPLRRVHDGDRLTLTTANGTHDYRVTSTKIVGPDDVYVLDATPQPTVTLVTCYPFEFIGHAPRRFIVQAQLVD
ncbi:MAG TPA: class D sortase [Vicinamibacterales bacterium]|nr:class D sortase [Vicinamibacterales bacterium]